MEKTAWHTASGTDLQPYSGGSSDNASCLHACSRSITGQPSGRNCPSNPGSPWQAAASRLTRRSPSVAHRRLVHQRARPPTGVSRPYACGSGEARLRDDDKDCCPSRRHAPRLHPLQDLRRDRKDGRGFRCSSDEGMTTCAIQRARARATLHCMMGLPVTSTPPFRDFRWIGRRTAQAPGPVISSPIVKVAPSSVSSRS